ncbi:MAG: hypothetical protein NC452_07745 [Eubacterium sp.]|nr:hypothetical protein [Eubacterium sp.]
MARVEFVMIFAVRTLNFTIAARSIRTDQLMPFGYAEAIRRIVNNPTYLGHLVQLRTTTVSYKNHKIN